MLQHFRFAWQSLTMRREARIIYEDSQSCLIDTLVRAAIAVPGAWIRYEVRPAARKHAKVRGGR
jgi:hypothetical protein